MSQPIITTDISQIRPVFAQGAGENIKRYTQLKELFKQGMEYTVLAEPVFDGENKITWHTEFEGTPASFSKLSEDEQIAAKGKIKYQVNKLYKAVFRQMYRGSIKDVADLFKVLDSCIEIPDYDNIYRIQQPDGNSNFVIIKWGFTSDDFNAPTGLIKKLVPTKVDTVKLKVIKNSKPAANETVTIIYNGKEVQLITDDKGYIYMEDIPLGDKFSIYADGKENIENYVCNGSDEYHYLIGTSICNMNFFIRDSKGFPVSDTEISFTYDGRTYFETTDAEGRICLRDIPEGTEVVCRQRNMSDSFVCDPNTTLYEFVGVRPIAEIEVAIMEDNGEPVSGMNVRFDYSGKNIDLSTDINGKVSLDNMPPDTEFTITCSAPKYQTATTKLFAHEGINMTEIKVRRISKNGSMTIRVIDNNGEPIVNTNLRCETDDFKTDLVTDENGEVVVDNVNYNSNVVCTQIINGLGSHRHTFTFVKLHDIYILKGMKILSNVTNLEIRVVNKSKETVPNLRVTIDDGHNVLNRITNSDGIIKVQDLVQGRPYTLTTEYSGKTTEVEYVPNNPEEKLTITVGRSNMGFLLWLIPLIGLLGWLLVSYLIPWLIALFSGPLFEVRKDVTVTLRNQKDTSIAVSGAIMNLNYNGMVLTDTSDANGVCHFQLVEPNSDTVSATISAFDYISRNCDIYLHQADTSFMVSPVIKGITIKLKDEKTGALIPGAKIRIEYGDTKLDGVSGADGTFNFGTVPMDSTLQIKAVVNADGHDEYVSKFYFQKDKEIILPEKSLDVRDIPVECGATIKSDGFHSTIQTVHVTEPKGKLTIGFDTFSIPDEIIVYSGKASEISDDKVIFRTKGMVKGPYKKETFSYDTPDGIITVRVNGGDDSKTQWYVKVFCPSKPSTKK